MNYYFLLEDEQSLLKVLPQWLQYMEFKSTRVVDIDAVQENNYVLQSGQGVTQLITRVLFQTIDTILEKPGRIDKLVVILDSEEFTAEQRKQDVKEKIEGHYPNQKFDFDITIVVCNHCFETWLLGAKGLYPEHVEEESDFYPYYQYYNIACDDPENMIPPADRKETIAKYHFHYLHELLRYKKIRFSKSRPQNVATKKYFEDILERIETTEHIRSFAKFIDFVKLWNEMDLDKKDEN